MIGCQSSRSTARAIVNEELHPWSNIDVTHETNSRARRWTHHGPDHIGLYMRHHIRRPIWAYPGFRRTETTMPASRLQAIALCTTKTLLARETRQLLAIQCTQPTWSSPRNSITLTDAHSETANQQPTGACSRQNRHCTPTQLHVRQLPTLIQTGPPNYQWVQPARLQQQCAKSTRLHYQRKGDHSAGFSLNQGQLRNTN